MTRFTRLTAFVFAALASLVLLTGCGDRSEAPIAPGLALHHSADAATPALPMKVQFREGSFIVVPFGDPRIPAGTPIEGCPVGEANPELGVPAGFPNGGGVVVTRGTGEATHLGRFEFVQTQCAIQFFPVTDPPFVNFDVRSTLISADGSRIFVAGPFATTFLTPSPVRRPIFDITGGTGRWEGAAGWLPQSTGLVVTCTDDTPFCLEGTFTGGSTEGEILIPSRW